MTTYVTKLWFAREPKAPTEIIIVEAQAKTAYDAINIALDELGQRVTGHRVTRAESLPKGSGDASTRPD